MKLRESYNAEIKALAMRRATRNKVVLLDDPISSDKWLFSQPDGLEQFQKQRFLLFTPLPNLTFRDTIILIPAKLKKREED